MSKLLNRYLPVEDALSSILVGDVNVEYAILTNEGDLSERDIFPEGDRLWDLSLLKLLLGVQVEHLLDICE